MGRVTLIIDPEGNKIEPFRSDGFAYLEKLDGRTPLYKYYKYRFSIGGKFTSQFQDWMVRNFGPAIEYGVAKRRVKYGEDLTNVPWVLHIDNKSYYKRSHIYFNQECEVLIRLNFIKGTTS